MAETPSKTGVDTGGGAPTLLWLRRDLRLGDHPALAAALTRGRPIIPAYVFDPIDEALLGAAPRWRLAQALAALSAEIEALGGRLILRRGEAGAALAALARETGAAAVYWSRYYEASAIERDKAVKAALRARGLEAQSFGGFLMREPFETTTQSGGFFKVYTPFRKAFAPPETLETAPSRPARWPAPRSWPNGLSLRDLDLEAGMRRGAAVVARYAAFGEAAAEARLERFIERGLAAYADDRDRLDRDGTSRLSAHLALGEISPRRAWAAAAQDPKAEAGARVFQQELIWREFAWHLAYHTPHIRSGNWRAEWDRFPWRAETDDAAAEAIERWRQGRTGVAVIDAAMRELYVTGVMHNRARMLVGSYLTKNLLVDWRVGERWFAEHLVDFDPASNAMGWQWVAGSGPDAAPFFRIFNPETQAEKFDPAGVYVRRWLPEARRRHPAALALSGPEDGVAGDDGLAFFEACPKSWALCADDPYPEQLLPLKAGRERALAAYQAMRAA
ncbi:MAG: deoxyribodipyrimidine photo-lyase [Pseudomonadota bacterium]